MTFSASERRVIDAEDHRDCWFINCYYRQRLRIVRIGNSFADVDVLDPGKRDDLAHARALCQLTFQAFKNIKLFHSRFLDGAFVTGNHDLLIARNLARKDSPYRQPADVFAVVHVRYQKLQRIFAQCLRRGNSLDDLIEQRL